MVDISRKTCERNGVKTIIDNDGILWLDENICKKDQIIKMCETLRRSIIQIIENIDVN